jgi:hypothetical protein
VGSYTLCISAHVENCGAVVVVPRKALTKLLNYCYPLAVFNDTGRFRSSLVTDLGNLRTLLPMVSAHDLGTVFYQAYNQQSDNSKCNATPIQARTGSAGSKRLRRSDFKIMGIRR